MISMRLHRFFIKEKIEKGKETKIDNLELLHQWLKVFRLSSSDRVIVFNGNGFEYEGYFRVLNKKEAVLFLDKEKKVDNEQNIELHIFQSIIKKDNFEFVVQKCTEIGVSAFHPVITERSEKKSLNMERLNKIATEASEQSFRGDIPKIFDLSDLENSLKDFSGSLFVLDFDGKDFSSIKIKDDNKVGLLIGPEGGWSETERGYFREKGIRSVSLGKQVLRAETSAIVASALILLK